MPTEAPTEEQQAEVTQSTSDEERIRIDVNHDNARVIISFSKTLVWVGLTPGEARTLASVILETADKVPNQGYQS